MCLEYKLIGVQGTPIEEEQQLDTITYTISYAAKGFYRPMIYTSFLMKIILVLTAIKIAN